MATAAAHLPDAVIGALPGRLEKLQEAVQPFPACLVGREAQRATRVEAAQHLAEHVELKLPGGGVACAHRARTFVAGQPAQLELGKTARASDVVHDLNFACRPCARSQEPVTKRAGLLDVAPDHERIDGEARVAQPTVAVVPVAHAAQCLGERGRERGDHAAGRLVSEALEGEKRAHEGILERALVGAAAYPLLPACFGLAQLFFDVESGWRRPVRGMPGELKGQTLAFLDPQIASHARVRVFHGRGHAQRHRIGADRELEPACHAGEPGLVRAIPKAHVEQHLDRHFAIEALQQAHHVASPAVREWHEVDDAQRTSVAQEIGLEDEGVAAVALLDLADGLGGADGPAAMLVIPE